MVAAAQKAAAILTTSTGFWSCSSDYDCCYTTLRRGVVINKSLLRSAGSVVGSLDVEFIGAGRSPTPAQGHNCDPFSTAPRRRRPRKRRGYRGPSCLRLGSKRCTEAAASEVSCSGRVPWWAAFVRRSSFETSVGFLAGGSARLFSRRLAAAILFRCGTCQLFWRFSRQLPFCIWNAELSKGT